MKIRVETITEQRYISTQEQMHLFRTYNATLTSTFCESDDYDRDYVTEVYEFEATKEQFNGDYLLVEFERRVFNSDLQMSVDGEKVCYKRQAFNN